MSEHAIRIANIEAVDHGKVCYLKEDGIWWLYLPSCGFGNLANHTITEHEDGTITVSPSILMTGHCAGEPTQRHGYLEHGVWRDA